MPISIACPCGHRMKVPDVLAGKQLLCDKCRTSLSVPGGSKTGKHVSGIESSEGDPRLKHKTKRSKKKPAPTAVSWPWIAGGVGVLLAVALGVGGLVWMLKRGEMLQPATQGPSEATAKSEPATLPHKPDRGPGALAKAAPPVPASAPTPPPKSPPLSEEDKWLQALFKCELALFGPARFDEEAFAKKSLTGVVVEVQGLANSALARFQAAAISARSTAGASIPAGVVFIAAGREGLADAAQLLPNTVGRPRDVLIGAERFRPWLPEPARLLDHVEVLDTVKGHVRAVLRGTIHDRPEDVLLALPVLLQPQGGVEYGFVPGKKVAMGFLFAAPVEELTSIKLLGYTLSLEPSKRAGKASFTAEPRNAPVQAPRPAAPPPALREVGKLVAPEVQAQQSGLRRKADIMHFAFSPDGQELFGGGPLAGVVWDLKEQNVLKAQGIGFDHVAYTKDGKRRLGYAEIVEPNPVNGFKGFGFITWDPKGKGELGKELTRAIPPLPKSIPLGARDIRYGPREVLVFSPDGKTAVAPPIYQPTRGKPVPSNFQLRVYSVARGVVLRSFAAKHMAPVRCLARSPDGKLVVSGSEDETARVWDVATGKEVAAFRGHSSPVATVVFSSDGQLIASAGHVYPNGQQKGGKIGEFSVFVWEAKTGKPIARFQGHSSPVFGLGFTSDDRRILSLSDFSSGSAVLLWEAATGKEVGRFPLKAWRLAMGPDGLIATTHPTLDPGVVRLWRLP